MMRLDIGSPLPLHAQLEDQLMLEIAGGALSPGTRLPHEDVLAERFAVSRTTVRTAIQSLIGRGVVEIHRGKGTFVTQPKITQELTQLTGFVEDMQALGREPTARVLDRRTLTANAAVAQHLTLPKGDEAVRVHI